MTFVMPAPALTRSRLVSTSSGEAQRFLKSTGWRLETALDAFYNDPSACKAAELSRERSKGGDAVRNLEKLWDHYRGACGLELPDDIQNAV